MSDLEILPMTIAKVKEDWVPGSVSSWIYNAALYSLTDQNTMAFKEVAIIHHPRHGEYAFGFITSSVILQVNHDPKL